MTDREFRTAKSARTFESILEAATRLFMEQGFYQTTINRARRWSSARAYLRDAKKRKNLTIATSAIPFATSCFAASYKSSITPRTNAE